MELRESETFRNLMKAYEGELKASGKYRVYAKRARIEGYIDIAEIFEETSGNEEHHAEIWLNLLNGGRLPETSRNLENAHEDEKKECMRISPKKRNRRALMELPGFSERWGRSKGTTTTVLNNCPGIF